MNRVLPAGLTTLALLLAATTANAGDKALLDKKDKLTKADPGYKPKDDVLKPIADNPHKVYTLKATKGDKLVIRMKSSDVDSVVVVEDKDGKVLGFNDDDPDSKDGTLDSKLVWTVPDDGEYRIVATCLVGIRGKFGDFHLTVEKAK
jgi:hypothetical protein